MRVFSAYGPGLKKQLFWDWYLKAKNPSPFELFGTGGPGWQCYTVGAFGGDKNVASLGLIPISPRLSPVPKPARNA